MSPVSTETSTDRRPARPISKPSRYRDGGGNLLDMSVSALQERVGGSESQTVGQKLIKSRRGGKIPTLQTRPSDKVTGIKKPPIRGKRKGADKDDDEVMQDALDDSTLFTNYKRAFPNEILQPNIFLTDGSRLLESHGVIPLGSLSRELLESIDLNEIMTAISDSGLLRKQGGYFTLQAEDVDMFSKHNADLKLIVEEATYEISQKFKIPRECVKVQFAKANVGPDGGFHKLHEDAFNGEHCRAAVQVLGINEGSAMQVVQHYELQSEGSAEKKMLNIYNGALTLFVPSVGKHGLPNLPHDVMQLTIMFEVEITSLITVKAIAPAYPSPTPYESIPPTPVSAFTMKSLLEAARTAPPSRRSQVQRWRSQLGHRLYRALCDWEEKGLLSKLQFEKLDKWRKGTSRGGTAGGCWGGDNNPQLIAAKAAAQADPENAEFAANVTAMEENNERIRKAKSAGGRSNRTDLNKSCTVADFNGKLNGKCWMCRNDLPDNSCVSCIITGTYYELKVTCRNCPANQNRDCHNNTISRKTDLECHQQPNIVALIKSTYALAKKECPYF